ncbi:hypothetical protein YIM_08875 [Amycolatopsis sp. YIM 10]|nr:hypothetical protein YIM_08875 [Amycolatopsis sp. YIM 10]
MEWWASATVRVLPDDEPDTVQPWHEAQGTALSIKPLDEEAIGVTVFEANGLTIDLQHIDDVRDALDARSADYAEFIPLFGDRDRFGFVTLKEDLEEGLNPSAVTSSSSIEYSSHQLGADSAALDASSLLACSAGSAPTHDSSPSSPFPSTSTVP